MSLMHIVGGDFGNRESSVATGIGRYRRHVTIPSYVGEGSFVDVARLRSQSQSSGPSSSLAPLLADDEITIQRNGGERFVGRLALEQANHPTDGLGDISRYWNGHCRDLLLATVPKLLGIDPSRKSATLKIGLVTGLPIEVFTRTTAEMKKRGEIGTVEKVQQSLVGEHHYTWCGVDIQLEIVGVLLMMEGFGAMALYGSADPEIPQAIGDIGGRTTDLAYAHGQRAIRPRCRGKSIGVDEVLRRLDRYFQQTYDQELDRQLVRRTLRAYAQREEQPKIFVSTAQGRHQVQLNGQLSTIVQEVGAEVGQFMAQTWASGERGKVASEVAMLRLIGGGAYFFRRQVEAYTGPTEVSDAPELDNVYGYTAVGEKIPAETWPSLR